MLACADGTRTIKMAPLLLLLMTTLSVAVARSDGATPQLRTSSHKMVPPTQHQQRQLIINGHKAPKGRYPYFSTLHHDCGGSLIAPDTILTAGHCLPRHKSDVEPHVGRYSFNAGNGDDDGTEYRIVHMVRHPLWRMMVEEDYRHDVTLLFLDRPSKKQHIKLNRNASLPYAGESLTAMGVGWTTADYTIDDRSMVLRQVELNYLPNDQCRLASSENGNNDNDDGSDDGEDDDDDDGEPVSYQDRIHPDHLCTTGGPHNERDACAYDSGSPIIIQGNTPQEDILVALVSGGEGCANPNFPAINARVSDALDFINENVCKYSVNPPPEFGCYVTTEPTVAPTTMAPTEVPTMAPTEVPTLFPTTTEIENRSTTYYFDSKSLAAAVMIIILILYRWCSPKGVCTTTKGRPFLDDNDDDIQATSSSNWQVSPLPPHIFEKPFRMLEKRFSTSSETQALSSPSSSSGSPAINVEQRSSFLEDNSSCAGSVVSYGAVERTMTL